MNQPINPGSSKKKVNLGVPLPAAMNHGLWHKATTWLPAIVMPITILGVFFLAELVLRLSLFGIDAVLHLDRYSPRANILSQQVIPLNDPVLPYRLGANVQTWFKGAPFSTNRWGFRNPPLLMEKPKGRLRVVVLGASVTMGAGVGDAQTYVAQLQALLDQKAPGKFEFINAGVAGYRSNQVTTFYDRFVARFNPDIILYPLAYSGQGGLQQAVEESYPTLESRLPKWHDLRAYLVDSFLYTAIRGQLGSWAKQHLPRDWQARGRNKKPQNKRLTANVLSGFVARRHAEGIPVILLALHRIKEASPQHQRHFRQQLDKWVQDNPGVWLVDTVPVLHGIIKPRDAIFPGDSHPNAHVHKLYAQAIMPRLLQLANSTTASHGG